ncbi:MAG: TolC family protein, partial [Bacteroidetes bacterium]|nr:TolC family protein [Bacteroidota bacterium]MBU1760451.1 TolC family protein [Bacteroidota bacterium]
IMLKSLILIFFILFPFYLKAQEKNLDYFINQAKTNSPLLNDYQNQLLILSLDSSKLRAGLKPQVNASSNLLYAPIIRGIGFDPAITNGQIVSALVTVSKQITTKDRLNTLLKSLQLNRDSLGNQRAFTVLDLERGVSAQYITTWGDQQIVQLAKETLQLLEKQDTLLKKLTQGSVFKQTEYLAFKVNLEQQYLTLMQSQNQYKNDFAALNYLSGIADTTSYAISSPPVRVINVPKFTESLLFKKYQIDSLKTLNALDQLSLNYKPKLNVFADGGYQSSLPQQAYKNFGWSVGLNLSIPIYDGGLRKLTTQQINLNQRTQNKYRDFYKIQYDQQKNQFQRMIDQYESSINKAKKQLNYSKTLIDANALQMKTGDVRMTDYLISINNYLNLRVNIIQNKINQLQMINQLQYLK